MSTALKAPPSTAPLTVEEFAKRYAGQAVELIDGLVQELPMAGMKHGMICSRLCSLLLTHVDAHDLGRVASNDTWARTGTARVRGGDVIYYSYERLPKDHPVPDGVHSLPPDLVGEVKSPTDRWVDLFAKVVEYLKAGVRVVLVLDPARRTASLYQDDQQLVLGEGDTLTLPDLLPGFAVPVARFFE